MGWDNKDQCNLKPNLAELNLSFQEIHWKPEEFFPNFKYKVARKFDIESHHDFRFTNQEGEILKQGRIK